MQTTDVAEKYWYDGVKSYDFDTNKADSGDTSKYIEEKLSCLQSVTLQPNMKTEKAQVEVIDPKQVALKKDECERACARQNDCVAY